MLYYNLLPLRKNPNKNPPLCFFVYYSFSGRGTITPLIKNPFKPRSGSVYPPHKKPPLIRNPPSGGKTKCLLFI